MNKSTRFIIFGFLAVMALFLAACNAALPAGAEAKVTADGKSAQVEFSGVVNSITANQWVISGQTVLISAQTVIDGVFAAGDSVKVHATVTTDGAVTADKIESPSAASGGDDSQATPGAFNGDAQEFTGKVEAITAESWTVEGQLFAVNAQTEIKDNILLGDMVKVHFVKNADGTFTATEIELAGDQADNSEQTNLGEAEITGKVDAFTPEAWIVKGQVFAVNAQTEIKDTIYLGDVIKVHYMVNPDGTFAATEIELAGDNQGHNSEKKLAGVLNELTQTQATIGNIVVLISSQTKLDSGLVIGEPVKAEVVTNPDGSVTALKIETLNNSKKDDNSGNGNSGSNSGSGRGDDKGSDDHKTPEPGDDNGNDN
jgi:hypothetical protein